MRFVLSERGEYLRSGGLPRPPEQGWISPKINGNEQSSRGDSRIARKIKWNFSEGQGCPSLRANQMHSVSCEILRFAQNDRFIQNRRGGLFP